MLALSDDIDSVCLVRECRELEDKFGTHFTTVLLNKKDVGCLKRLMLIESNF